MASSATSSPLIWGNYHRIDAAVCREVERLIHPDSTGASKAKGVEVRAALDRLWAQVMSLHPSLEPYTPYTDGLISKLNPNQKVLDLTSLDVMMDAEIDFWQDEPQRGFYRQISIRTALSISTLNVANILGSAWGPWWGKATSLENVEAALRKL